HEQGHRAWYAYSAGCQLSPPGGLGSDHPTLDLINKAAFRSKQYSPKMIIVTSNAILAVQQFYLFIFCERRASSIEGM
ncbi:hypothetical protein ACJHXU_24390, partial [Escherichia sp. WS2893_1]|uniref:hypothetical protein n=1 Tax=Escherichia sp. WS2893_1 TaxID=3381971 RepID=UPI00396C6D17